MKSMKYWISVSILMCVSSSFATSKCDNAVLNLVKQKDTYSSYSVRDSGMIKAGQAISVEADLWDTHLKTDSLAVLIDQETMGVLMDIHVVLVDPSSCQVLERFRVPASE